jgi:TetR/AcrR family transcriptional regulator, cholesterol catabolism regulator
MAVSNSKQVGLRGHQVRSPERARERSHAAMLAAAEVFASKGYADATMDDISERLGGTKGTLYYYFRSKEDIFSAIKTSAIGAAIKRLEAIIARSLEPEEELREALHDLVGHIFTSLDHYAVVLANPRSLSPENRRKIRELQQRYENLITGIIERGIRKGVFVDRDPKLTTFTLLRAAMSVAFWYRPDGPLKSEYITESVSDLLLAGVLNTTRKAK